MLPADVSDRRFSETAGLEIYRHNLSSLSRSHACAATPACRITRLLSQPGHIDHLLQPPAESVTSIPCVLAEPHRNPIADQASNERLHRIVIHTIQLQVAAFFITLQNTLAFKILSYAVADSVYELG
jgi:hypothetical protein